MTSTLIAKLVEQGKLKWDTTLAEVFPDLAPQMHADFKAVTLLQLLSHRAGLPQNLTFAKYTGDDVMALRLRVAQEELAKRSQSPPGKPSNTRTLDTSSPVPWRRKLRGFAHYRLPSYQLTTLH